MTGISRNILVVDDEPIIVELCSEVLESRGYAVRGAASGQEALRSAAGERFDLALLDLRMSGLDGLQTFAALRQGQPDLIGILITAHGTVETAIQAMESGFIGFVRKPFTPTDLVQAVEEAFRKKALLDDNTRLRTLIPLFDLGEKFIRSQDRGEIFQELIRTVGQLTGAQRISVMIYDETRDRLRIAASIGLDETAAGVQTKPGDRIAGWVFQRAEPLILNGGPEDNPRFAGHLRIARIAAAISFPLKARDRTLGVLNVSKLEGGYPFSEADIETLSVICGQAVMALENLRIMEERAERIRMRTLLEQYVAPEIAEVLISHGHNPLDVGEIRIITVLFADIRNFTPLVRQLDLQTLRSFLNDFFDLLSEVIFRFKGTLDKFMGDAALAIFGAPIPIREPQQAAVGAALQIAGEFERLQAHWAGRAPIFSQVGIGIGVTCGEMFLGNVGSHKRLDYTVIGSDVNLAQRLASEAASGQILISRAVREKLGSLYQASRESLRAIRGLDQPVPVFTLERGEALGGLPPSQG